MCMCLIQIPGSELWSHGKPGSALPSELSLQPHNFMLLSDIFFGSSMDLGYLSSFKYSNGRDVVKS